MTSNAVQGVIQEIGFRKINKDGTPDQWGKTDRVDVTVNGTRYGFGSVKPSPRGDLQLRVQNGKDWVTLEQGDTVQFFIKSREVNGKTYSDKEGQPRLVAKGNGQSQAAPALAPSAAASSPAPARAPSPMPGKDAMQDRIEAGMYLNNAMALIAAGKFSVDAYDSALAYVKGVHEAAKAVVAGAPAVSPAVAPKPAPAPVAAAPTPADDFGDELPF